MSAPNFNRARPEYLADIEELRGRLSDDQIADVLERYQAGGLDRDQTMEALAIDYIGLLYELIAVYEIEAPAPDPAEEERQATVMSMLLNGEEVPMDLRQPASWRVRH
ncbi:MULTISPECIES: hypothetical protein [unclassified Ensifer]|uniref:hypothetical protein n=1 Tax=unclassified Ensifer TaxID=2633371 RepID=UPI000813747E|nr:MULTISPECIES: hypothetical protein [unclassified Ensifer]OCP07954.1 hypothetical protein BC362_10110 [Ensifer sp. LC14]OCP10936.1 hypothetical protein BC374_17855 [Ensifer sp. LC13]OCP11521.1 hypothetical protein BBX50_18005 [Ensifer sp. LC11]OCP33337.1 hypothetical protein BC364_16890 [Ensifer sp. LC499]